MASKVAHRYARAVFEFVKTPSKARTLSNELSQFWELIRQHSDLEKTLLSDVFTTAQRRGIVEDLAGKLKLSSETVRVLLVVSELKRLRNLAPIAAQLRELCLEAEKIIPIRVEHATPLTQDEQKKIETRFQGLFGGKVEASYALEPSILGGLRVTASGKTYDGSIAGWLNDFEEKLVGGSI